ncbi:hypothetical protein B0H14DRAFT_2566593 [Mycena olivaceomarginata]|nr:hypothetical protein B0H14DRAFT_2566593 [Mycena olivaceomarginata]
MNIQTLIAENAYVETVVGQVEGTSNSSRRLNLAGQIDANINLSNHEQGQAAQLQLDATYGNIQANINLESSKDSGAAFDITAHSTSAGLRLDVLCAPLDSKVTLRATTFIGAVAVKLPATYEGAFSATTSGSQVDVKFDKNAEDPARRERRRRLDFERPRQGAVSGNVGWSEEGRTRWSFEPDDFLYFANRIDYVHVKWTGFGLGDFRAANGALICHFSSLLVHATCCERVQDPRQNSKAAIGGGQLYR